MNESLAALLARVKDPYGHEGVQPEPPWSSIWTRWTDERRIEYLQEVARGGIYSFDQVIDVLQGMPPRPHGWDRADTYLGENSAAVERFRFDVDKGVMPSSLSAKELRAWCRARSIEIPDLIRIEDGVEEDEGGEAYRTPTAGHQPLANWIPLPAQEETPVPSKPGRGRKRTTTVRNHDLREAAKKHLFDQAQRGIRVTQVEIADYLATQPCGRDMSQAALKKVISGTLPMTQAEEIARANGAVAPPPKHRAFKQI